MTSENLVTAKEGITLEEAKTILAKARDEKLPIVDDDFNLKGLSPSRIFEKQIKYPQFCKRREGPPALRRSTSVSLQMCWNVSDALVKAHVDVVVLDSAMAHSANVIALCAA